MDPLKEIQNKLDKQEKLIESLRVKNNEWRTKNHQAELKIKSLELKLQNQSEVEHLRLENARLQIEINKLKRNERAVEKIQKIKQILG